MSPAAAALGQEGGHSMTHRLLDSLIFKFPLVNGSVGRGETPMSCLIYLARREAHLKDKFTQKWHFRFVPMPMGSWEKFCSPQHISKASE